MGFYWSHTLNISCSLPITSHFTSYMELPVPVFTSDYNWLQNCCKQAISLQELKLASWTWYTRVPRIVSGSCVTIPAWVTIFQSPQPMDYYLSMGYYLQYGGTCPYLSWHPDISEQNATKGGIFWAIFSSFSFSCQWFFWGMNIVWIGVWLNSHGHVTQ